MNIEYIANVQLLCIRCWKFQYQRMMKNLQCAQSCMCPDVIRGLGRYLLHDLTTATAAAEGQTVETQQFLALEKYHIDVANILTIHRFILSFDTL